jgi:hypothetical protein
MHYCMMFVKPLAFELAEPARRPMFTTLAAVWITIRFYQNVAFASNFVRVYVYVCMYVLCMCE